MEENVALDTSKQKQFVKSIKGIKKLIKKAEGDAPEIVVTKQKDGKKTKRKRPDRGLVYLSHIPHGFYEHEMTQYFGQFGSVTNVRVIRSKRTGNSKGFAFVEFKQPEVAEIVAETMNNYLMGKRLIKAACIPPEKQKVKAMRKHWSRLNNPTMTERLKQKKAYNKNKDEAGELARARRYLSNYRKNMKKLSVIGINYDFFTPVDIPKELKENSNPAENKTSPKKELHNKDNKKEQKTEEIKQSASKKKEKEEQKQVDSKKEKKIKASTNKNIKDIKETDQMQLESKKGKKSKTPEPVVNKKEQKQKQLKLKEAGVKAPENFIQLQKEGDSDSDESADFDLDDYNNMIEDESDVDSGGHDSDNEDESDDESGGDDDESDVEQGTNDENESDEFEITGSDDDESDAGESEDEEIIPPPKKGKAKGPTIPAQPVQKKGKGPIPPLVSAQEKQAKTGKQIQSHKPTKSHTHKGPNTPVDHKDPKAKGQKGPKAEQKVQKGPAQQKGPQAPELGKRKAPQKSDVSPKKPKFEKQTQQPMKKQFKKKK